MKFKKSQMEIMGLVVIVILLTLGMLFVAKFMMGKGSPEQEIFTRKFLASSTLGAMMETNYECPGNQITVVDLLEACVEVTEYDCGESPPKTSCEKAHEVINGVLLLETLDVWGKDYYFEVVSLELGAEKQLLVFEDSPIGSECSGDKDSEERALQTDKGILKMSLSICGKQY